jgi:DNA-binding response OmpR family regulator
VIEMSWREEIKKEESMVSRRTIRIQLENLREKLEKEENSKMAVIFAIGYLDTIITGLKR